MSKYLILGESLVRDLPQYLGTYRDSPSPMGHHYKSKTERDLFEWYFSESGQIGALTSLEKAKALVDYCAVNGQRFEVVRILEKHETCLPDELLLGFDISNALNYSLVHCLKINPAISADLSLKHIDSLSRLLRSYFEPKLNSNDLFDAREDAELCLACMMELQNIRPNLYEGPGAEFEVIGLCTVYTPTSV